MKQLLLIFLLTLSCNARAEWVEYLSGANGDIFFFDNARVQKNGNVVRVWNRVRFKSSVMGASSYQRLVKIDCAAYSETTLQGTYYIDEDWTRPAMATDTNEKPRIPIKTNSPTKQLANILCKE